MRTLSFSLVFIASLLMLAGCLDQTSSRDSSSFSSTNGTLVSTPSAPTLSGHEAGNGGDDFRLHGNAWFVGKDHVVTYCIETAPEFPVERDTVQNIIQDSFTLWISYMKEKSLGTARHPLFYVAQKYEPTAECTDQTPLRFLFGNSNTGSGGERLNFSFGGLHRQSYDPELGTSRGYVWLNQDVDWKVPEKLKGALLHLIGRILGCGEIPGTIVRREFASDLATPLDENVRHRLTQVASQRDVAVANLVGNTGEYPLVQGEVRSSRLNEIVGRPLSGPVHFSRTLHTYRGEIYFQDSIGRIALPATIVHSARISGDNAAFKVSLIPPREVTGRYIAGLIQKRGEYTQTTTLLVQAQTTKGEPIKLVIEQNMGNKKLVIKEALGLQTTTLFENSN